MNVIYSTHKSREYRSSNLHKIICYYCHRPGYITLECADIRCYACGRRVTQLTYCDVNRPRRDTGRHSGRYSPERYSSDRGSIQYNDDRNSNHLKKP